MHIVGCFSMAYRPHSVYKRTMRLAHSITAVGLILLACGSLSVAEDKRKPIIFEVNDCKPTKLALKTQPANDVMGKVAGDPIEAFSKMDDQEWVSERLAFKHPFLCAAYLSFNDHRPLALTPDMIWQLLIQQAAKEVANDPETYRKLLALHDYGKRTISVERNNFQLGNPKNDWPGVFSELEKIVLNDVPNSPAKHFSQQFSTSTPADVAARRIVFLNAASHFYDYHVATFCGIPQIELHGTPDDWRWIKTKAGTLKQFNMERRIESLTPIFNEIIEASKGKPNREIWKSFFKLRSESGGGHISGWINLFFIDESDEHLDLLEKNDFSWEKPEMLIEQYGGEHYPLKLHIRHYRATGKVDVDFIWEYLGKTYPMRVSAGFMGIQQDPESLTLTPVSGWQVFHKKLSMAERNAVDYLGNMTRIGPFEHMIIRRDFSIDTETGVLKAERSKGDIELNAEFWAKAIPLMTRFSTINLDDYINSSQSEDERASICKAILSANSITSVNVSSDIDSKCLEILRSRKDLQVIIEEGSR